MPDSRYQRVEIDTEMAAPPTIAGSGGHGPALGIPGDFAYRPYSGGGGGSNHAHSNSRNSSHSAQHPTKAHPIINSARDADDHVSVRRLLFPWIWTILLTVTLVVIVKVYEKKGVLNPHDKDSFNGLSTAVILLLGLSFFEAFKALAKNLRGRIQQWFRPPASAERQVDGFENLLQVAELAVRRKPGAGFGLRAFCVVWITLCIIALGASALISLTYTIDDGNDFNTVYNRQGDVNVTNMTCFGIVRQTICPTAIPAQARAHAWGQAILSTGPGSYDQLSKTPPSDDFPYYKDPGPSDQGIGREFAYRFKEYNPNDRTRAYPHFTDRIVRTSSGPCAQYPEMVKLRKTGASIGGGIGATLFTYHNTTSNTNGNMTIPDDDINRDGTTYIFDGTRVPEHAEGQVCGPRCMYMWAYRNDPDPLFFRCPITVSEVSNAARPEHQISVSMARIAIASMASQGRHVADGKQNDTSDDNFRAFQFYAAGHPWEVHLLNTTKVGANLAEAAIGALSNMVNLNPKIQIPGTTPNLGSRLSVRWKYFEALLILIVVAHTVLVLLNFLAIRRP